MINRSTSSNHSIVEVLIRRWITASLTFAIVAILVAAVVALHKEKYAAVAHVLLVNDQAGRDPADAGLDMPTIVTSTTVLEQVKRKLHLSEAIPEIRKSIVARVAPRSSIMLIASQNHDRRIAVDLPNAVADSFVRVYSSLSNTHYSEVTRRLQADLDHKRRLVIRLEGELERASSGASYVGSQASLDATAAHLAELRESRGVTLGQVVSDRTSLQLARGELDRLSGAVRHEILMNNPSYHQSEIEVGRDVAGYLTTRAGVKASYPGIAGFRDKITKEAAALTTLRENVLHQPDAYSESHTAQLLSTDKTMAASAGDRARLSDLDEQIKTVKAALLNSPERGHSIGALRAERDVAEAQFQALALRLTSAEANKAESSSLGQVVVVDRAVKADTTLLPRFLLLALGLIMAAAIAVLAAYLAEALIPRLIEPIDVERIYGKPILATLGVNRWE